MKLIKFIFKLIGFILILLLIAIGIVIWLAVDTSPANYDSTKETAQFEEIIGRGFSNSIDEIKLLSKDDLADAKKNNISLDISTDELNAYIVTMIQQSVDKEYMVSKDYIMEESGVTLESIFFEELDGKLAAKARISAFGFYHTSVLLSGDLKLDQSSNKLKIEFENFKLGKKIKINRSIVLKLLKKFNIKMNTGSNFDLDTLTLTFDISGLMNGLIEGSKFEDFFNNCDYDFTYLDGKLHIIMDTTKVFVGKEELPDLSGAVVIPAYDNIDLLAGTATMTFTEESFNQLIQQSFNNTESSYGTACEIGGYNFKFELREMYFDISEDKVLANLYLNELGTKCTVAITVSTTKDSDGFVNSLTFNVHTIKLGNMQLSSVTNFFETIEVPADTLTSNGAYKISNITFDKTASTVIMDVSLW